MGEGVGMHDEEDLGDRHELEASSGEETKELFMLGMVPEMEWFLSGGKVNCFFSLVTWRRWLWVWWWWLPLDVWMSGLQTFDFVDSLSMGKWVVSRSPEDTGFLPGLGLGGSTHFLLVVILIGSFISNGRSLTGVNAEVGMCAGCCCGPAATDAEEEDKDACFLFSCVELEFGVSAVAIFAKFKRGKEVVNK